MNDAELKSILADPERFANYAFDVLREIAHMHALAEADGDSYARQEARQLVIRCLERRERDGHVEADPRCPSGVWGYTHTSMIRTL